MKTALFVLALLCAAPLAQAQVTLQVGPTPKTDNGDYWRQGSQWRARDEYKEEAQRKPEWQHSHCVTDYQHHEYCRQ